MDCSHLPQAAPPSNPIPAPNPYPNPSPNPYLYPQPHDAHSVPYDPYQYYAAAPADPIPNNAVFAPQFHPQHPSVHYPYAPPPASVHAPFHLVSPGPHAAAPYYADPSANWTPAAGHYVPGPSNYAAAVNSVAAPPPVNLPQITVSPSQKEGTKKKKKKKKKTKIPVPHAWCDVCNIDCTSKDVLDVHIQGKKHKKNLGKLKWTKFQPIVAVHPPPPPLPAPSPSHLPPKVATSTPAIGLQVSSPTIAAASSPAPSPGVAPSPPKIATSNPTSPKDKPAIEPQASPTPLPVSVSASTDQPIARQPSQPAIATSNTSPTSPRDKPIIEPQVSTTPLSVSTSSSTDQPIAGHPSPPTVATSNPASPIDKPIIAPLPVSMSESTDQPIPGHPSPPNIATSNIDLSSHPTSPVDKPTVEPQVPPTVVTTSSSTDQPIIGPSTAFAPSPTKTATSNPLPVSDQASPTDRAIIGPQVAPTVVTTSSALAEQPIIGPLPQLGKVRASSSKGSKKRGRAATMEDFEMKRRKVLENGTPAEDVHVCDVCNIVCNSETVFKSHIAGRKHIAAAAGKKKKKLASAGVATTTTT